MVAVRIIETDTILQFHISKTHKEFVWWRETTKDPKHYNLGGVEKYRTILFSEFYIKEYLKQKGII